MPTPSNALILAPIGSYASGEAGVGEIVAYDALSRKLFSLNGANDRLDVLDIGDPSSPKLVSTIDLSPYGATPNSVAVSNGIVAVAMEADPKTDPGRVVFFSTAGDFRSQVVVGAQPDMLTFTPDGSRVLVANEGEPNEGDTINPEGSLSIIDLSGGVLSPTVTTATFSAFDGLEAKLRGQGVRITAGKPFSVDAEPEYIAVAPDGSSARITLQENNALAVLDLSAGLTYGTITAIQALGLKDYATGIPSVSTYDFDEASLPVIGTTPAGQELKLGGFSGLFFEGIDAASGDLLFLTNTDRGPNGEPSDLLPAVPGNERPFALPAFAPELVRFRLNAATGQITISQRIALTQADGSTPLSGLPNLQAGAPGSATTDEVAVDLNGIQLANDPLGADLEGVVVAPDGSFWLPDEYRPAIYHFAADGRLLERLIPIGTASAVGAVPGSFGSEVLPAVYGQARRANRGFEAIAMEGSKLYAFIQTSLDNPGSAVRGNGVIRILEFDTVTAAVTGEFVYVMRDTTAAGAARTDKIGDAVALGGGRFLVAERDDRTGADANKLIYAITLTGATNVLGSPIAAATSGTTLESLSPDQLAAAGIRPVDKRLVVNAAAIGYTGVSKIEGLALVDGDTLAVLNDNDFQLAGPIAADGSAPINPSPEPIRLGLIDFSGGNGLDASDRDVDGSSSGGGRIAIGPQPVFGMYMPDGVASFSVGGRPYFITANEGDSREDFTPGEEIRVGAGGYVLDPATFPDAAALKNNAVLGRLIVSAYDGDLDGDGDIDRIQTYGARSFSIWDEAGNRVFDSGDAIERLTADLVPALFNGNGDAGSFDSRSDNKGPEPESVAIGSIGGRPYAFIGLERVGGILTYDLSDPLRPALVGYTNPATSPPGSPDQDDLAPEGLLFIPASDSPTGKDLLVTGNEGSGTTTIYTVESNTEVADFTLQILSYYGESGLLGVETAPILGALIDRFDDEFAHTLVLGEGDSYIPGPWLVAGADPSLNGVPGIGSTASGRPDIAIMNAFGTDASALGNHEFDLGSPVLAGALAPSGSWSGALFPFLTANLDFSADSSLRGLADAGLGGTATNAFAGQEVSTLAGRIAPYAISTQGGETIGLIGITTFELLIKSSPNGTVPKDDGDPATSDLEEVALYVQNAVDALQALGVDKIVMVDQLDTIERNRQLAPLVSGVDVMVAGGGHERLGDADDVPAAFPGHDASFVDTFPILTAGADGKPVLIVTTDTEYTYLGRLVVDFDANGEILTGNLDPSLNGAYAATEATLQAAYGTTESADRIIASSSIASQVQAITTAIDAVITQKDGTFFGYSDVYLEGDRVFGRAQEVNLGDISADANLFRARQALGDSVVLGSLKNGGGIRASIGSIGESGEKLPPAASPVKPAGAISQLDIENALRFDNRLMVFDTTPDGLLAILNHAAGLAPGNGGYAQVGGIHFSYDPSLPAGDRVRDVAVYDLEGRFVARLVDDGKVLPQAPASLSLVSLNFTANGGDGYPIKANGTNFRYLLAGGGLSAPIDRKPRLHRSRHGACRWARGAGRLRGLPGDLPRHPGNGLRHRRYARNPRSAHPEPAGEGGGHRAAGFPAHAGRGGDSRRQQPGLRLPRQRRRGGGPAGPDRRRTARHARTRCWPPFRAPPPACRRDSPRTGRAVCSAPMAAAERCSSCCRISPAVPPRRCRWAPPRPRASAWRPRAAAPASRWRCCRRRRRRRCSPPPSRWAARACPAWASMASPMASPPRRQERPGSCSWRPSCSARPPSTTWWASTWRSAPPATCSIRSRARW